MYFTLAMPASEKKRSGFELRLIWLGISEREEAERIRASAYLVRNQRARRSGADSSFGLFG